MEDQTNRFLGNITIRSCTIINTTCSEEGALMIACKKNDPWFAILTLIFIYLPSVNVIASLYGPKKAGMVGFVEGMVTFIVGVILAYIGYLLPSPVAAIVAWIMIFLGDGVWALGLNCWLVFGFSRPSVFHFCLFIPLMIFSPAIFIFIKLLAIFEAENMFIQSQSTFMSRGEAIMEAAPQLSLQLGVAMLSMNPSFNQIFSIITSMATLSLPNIENYVQARGEKFSFVSIIKHVAVFLPACLFKVLSFSIISVFFRAYTVGIAIGFMTLYWIIFLYFKFLRTEKFQDFKKSEYVALHCLTLASLGVSKMDAFLRTWLTILFNIIYTIILSAILVVCYVDPDMGSVQLSILGLDYNWSDLEIVKEPFFLNLILYSTIALGWMALFLDILCTWCKFKISFDDGFWDKTVLLEGLMFWKEIGQIETKL